MGETVTTQDQGYFVNELEALELEFQQEQKSVSLLRETFEETITKLSDQLEKTQQAIRSAGQDYSDAVRDLQNMQEDVDIYSNHSISIRLLWMFDRSCQRKSYHLLQ